MEKFEQLKGMLASMEADVLKFNNGNSAAGTRVRKGLQDIKNAAQALRIEVQEKKNNEKN